jgi:hypothetical protein
MELFDSRLLKEVSCPAPLVVRSLRSDDFDKGFLDVLAQLTQVGNVTKEKFVLCCLKKGEKRCSCFCLHTTQVS